MTISTLAPMTSTVNLPADFAAAIADTEQMLVSQLNCDIRSWDVRLSALCTGYCEAYAQGLSGCFVRCGEGYVYEFVDAASAARYDVWHAQRQTEAELADLVDGMETDHDHYMLMAGF